MTPPAMNRLALRLSQHPAAGSFALGALLGSVAGLMLRQGIGGVAGLVMALLLVACGTASGICLQLHRRPLPAGAVRRQAIRAWGVAVGLGVAAGLAAVGAVVR